MAKNVLRNLEKHYWHVPPTLKERAKNVGLRILKELLENPITVAEEFKQLPMLKMTDALSEKNLKKRLEATYKHYLKVL